MNGWLIPAVLVAGALGAILRFFTSRAFAPLTERTAFPFAVLAVNCVGSFVAGLVFGLVISAGLSTDWKLVLIEGFAGGLTTFSTWSVETIQLLREGRIAQGLLSPTINLVLGLGLVVAGLALTGAL